MNTAGWPGASRARAAGRNRIRMSVVLWARWWCVNPAGIHAARLAGTIDVPRSVCTDRTPRAAYTRCPRGWDCTELVPPDGHRWTPPDGHTRDAGPDWESWRPTSISWHSTGSQPHRLVATVEACVMIFT